MRCNIPNGDLQQKLNETICRYKGLPVYVNVIDGRGNLQLSPLTERRDGANSVNIKVTDPDFDIASPPLGYLNIDSKAYYVFRLPLRKVRQGLCTRHIRASTINGNPNKEFLTEQLVFTNSFVDMMIGHFPSLKEAINKIRKEHTQNPRSQSEVAISRDIALKIGDTGTISVYLKTEPIGWMEPDKMIVHVIDKKTGWVIRDEYLSEFAGWEIKG